ncbi:SAM-dependent methyltransferase [Salinibacter altiplanensis]|uniref:SAM-dependent methyltransferase n=1 Tax=Salinibacter altiplanensis TaxID=1803181 RepID=UPI000C9F6A2C|nr:methyltransferase domain-containing protein [Salinibacter altiplanensis]
MPLLRSLPPLLLALGLLLASGPQSGYAQQEDTTESTTLPELTPPEQESDVPYVPTPEPVVDRMLELANVDETDIVYDLGSGDGRIVIRAARTYGARGVGIEIDPARVEEARKNAQKAGVSDLVEFRQGDLFASNISDATVVTLYLLPSVNQKLRPILFEQLSPGTPVVSHDFDMGQWSPDRTVDLKGDTVYRWTIPEEIPEDLQDR